MAKQHLLIAYRNHIVMKHAFINYRRILSGENHLPGIDLIQAGDGLAGLERLPCRVAQRIIFAPLLAAVNKQLHAWRAVVAAEAVMVCRPFIAEQRYLGQRAVYGKPLLIGENRPQQRFGGRRFAGAMEFIVQVGDGQMHPAIQRIGRGGDRGGVSHPHR